MPKNKVKNSIGKVIGGQKSSIGNMLKQESRRADKLGDIPGTGQVTLKKMKQIGMNLGGGGRKKSKFLKF